MSCAQCSNSGCSGCGSLTIPEGPKGDKGDKGDTGDDGTDGLNGAPGPTWMSWSWSVGSDTPWIPGGAATGLPKIAAYIEYPGYNTVAIPTFVKLISRGLEASNDYDVDLYDVTHSLVLASISSRNNVAITLDALTVTPNNWPAGASVLAVRITDNLSANNRVALCAMTWHN